MKAARQGLMGRAAYISGLCHGGEQLMQQGSPLLNDTGIVRPQQHKKIALGLISSHLDDVGQMLEFRGDDHGPLVEFADFDALGNVAALVEEPAHARASFAQCLPSPKWRF